MRFLRSILWVLIQLLARGTNFGKRITSLSLSFLICRLLYIFFHVNFIFYFFYKFIHFNWRLITLQYCSGFAIHWHEPAMGVHVFPILNPLPASLPIPPAGSSQCTSPKHPVSCIKPGLVIHFTYDNIHVSTPFSKSSHPHPHPLPRESKRLFYTSVSLLLSRI